MFYFNILKLNITKNIVKLSKAGEILKLTLPISSSSRKGGRVHSDSFYGCGSYINLLDACYLTFIVCLLPYFIYFT